VTTTIIRSLTFIMITEKSSRRHALLVGVDFYPNDGSRKTSQDARVSLRNLQGSKNDVDDVRQMLATKFGILDPVILTSTAPPNGTAPIEPNHARSSYANISKHFKDITAAACAGDLFFFHYSGHGAQLPATAASRSGRSLDPSLLPMDFCLGQPPIPGWQLNAWLHKLYKKGVRVVVSLDSCHSGGSWRTSGNMRTVDFDWVPPVILPSDEEAVADVEPVGSDTRDAKQVESWDLSPSNFTLMAACKAEQTALEDWHDGKMRGAFSQAMVSCLNRSAMLQTYCSVRDKIEEEFGDRARMQTPQTYGHDRLLFLGSQEPFSVSSVYARIDSGYVHLPIGQVHGVKRGMEYTTMWNSVGVPLQIEGVDEFESRARVPDQTVLPRETGSDVYCSRWSTEKPLTVFVDASHDAQLRNRLLSALQQRIAGRISVDAASPHTRLRESTLMLKTEHGVAQLYRYDAQTNAEEAVPGLRISTRNPDEFVTKAAAAAAQLFRFQQIFDLQDQASLDSPPFIITFEQKGATRKLLTGGEVIKSNTPVGFSFVNTGDETLFLTVVAFSPAYNIHQLFPKDDRAFEVGPRGRKSFTFNMWLPDELCGGPHRDMLRCIVTKGKRLSFKSFELPNVWDAGHMFEMPESGGRPAELLDDEFEWWTRDLTLWTED
jgi:hypothetical protein